MCVSIFPINGPAECEVQRPFHCLFIYQFLLDFKGILLKHWPRGGSWPLIACKRVGVCECELLCMCEEIGCKTGSLNERETR